MDGGFILKASIVRARRGSKFSVIRVRVFRILRRQREPRWTPVRSCFAVIPISTTK